MKEGNPHTLGALPQICEKAWTQIAGVCNDDQSLLSKIEDNLDWDAGELCGMLFLSLEEVDFRRKSGRQMKKMLLEEPVEGEGSDKIVDDSFAAEEKCTKRKPALGLNTRRKRIKTVGRILYGISRLHWISTDSSARSAAARVTRFCIACYNRSTRRTRGILYYVPHLAANQQDCVTLCDISTIPKRYFFSVATDIPTKIGTKVYYAFDIRSLYHLILSGAPNPFTQSTFEESVCTSVKKRIEALKRLGYSVEMDSDDSDGGDGIGDVVENVSSVEQQRRLRVCALCQKLDKLVALTNIEWIMSLNLQQLVEWWAQVEDIVNWRSELTSEVRAKVVPGNAIFNTASKHALQALHGRDAVFMFVIDQMEKLVCEPEDMEHQSLGAMYVLTGLCCCSEGARITLPWLYQPPNIS